MFKGWAVTLALATTLLINSEVSAQNFSDEIHKNMVIQVKKNLPLHRGEPIRKDYVLNAGHGQGMEAGMIYPIYRRAPIHDPFFNRSRGDLVVHVGDLLVFHVEQEVSVARLHSLTDPASRPLLDEPAVMVGDAVNVSAGRKPAAAQVGPAPLQPEGAKEAAGLSPERALEVLESYQKAQAPKPQPTRVEESPADAGSLFQEDPNLPTPLL